MAGCGDRSRLRGRRSLLEDSADAESHCKCSATANYEQGSQEAREGDQGGVGGNEWRRGDEGEAADREESDVGRGAEESPEHPGEAGGVYQSSERGSTRLSVKIRTRCSFFVCCCSQVLIEIVISCETKACTCHKTDF